MPPRPRTLDREPRELTPTVAPLRRRRQSGPPPSNHVAGPYRLVAELGRGGMASVYLGVLEGPGGFRKWVAIKRLDAHLADDATGIDMFLDEAHVASRISHPNVATIFELGQDPRGYWIAMEYLHGEPLSEIAGRAQRRGERVPDAIACRILADAAKGLHAAHELRGPGGEPLGLVHRDATPHNIFVSYDGITKLIDFGIAKYKYRLTETCGGRLKGKPAYLSPEQVTGQGADRQSDVFTLGIVLWELVTGQRLFRMESDWDTFVRVERCDIPLPRSIRTTCPESLEEIVMRALARERSVRYPTARALSQALDAWLAEGGDLVGPDEVAAYMDVVFEDRILERQVRMVAG